MDKRYQIFVSSTYEDLKDERRAIIQTLLQMDCIPAGMELFPAANDEQFQFITKIIDDCDYYILIIGGRYGSTTSEGLSYTEKEFDYARSIGLRTLSFIHGRPDEIPYGKSEVRADHRIRLDEEGWRRERDYLFWPAASCIWLILLDSDIVDTP